MSAPASLPTRLRSAARWTLVWQSAPDVLPMVALVILALATGFFDGELATAAGAIVILLLLLRRAAPIAVLAAVTAGVLLFVPHPPQLWTGVAAIALASYTTGERATNRTISAGITLLAAA